MNEAKGSVFGGALLVAGTTIGGGMLALPVLTSPAGFWPSVCLYFLCWLFMASTGLLFLEVSQWMQGESNLVSMSSKILGKPGKAFAWILYLFLFFCLMVAYIVGCGNLLTQFLNYSIPAWMGPLIFVILFSPLLIISTGIANKLNGFLVGGLVLTYLAFIFLGVRYVNSDLLNVFEWSKAPVVLPIAFTAFAYQGVIPTLVHFMHHDVKSTRKAILIGSFIPLIAYVVWQWLVQGVVPAHGPGGLLEALEKGDNAVTPMKHFINNPSIYDIGQLFAFFALVTSFFGVSLGMRDFLADGLSIQKDFNGKVLLALLVCTVPLIIAVVYPNVFLTALDYAGGFGCALLLGLLPIMLVWRGRYHLNFSRNEQLPGGKLVLGLLALFVLFELTVEIRQVIGK